MRTKSTKSNARPRRRASRSPPTLSLHAAVRLLDVSLKLFLGVEGHAAGFASIPPGCDTDGDFGTGADQYPYHARMMLNQKLLILCRCNGAQQGLRPLAQPFPLQQSRDETRCHYRCGAERPRRKVREAAGRAASCLDIVRPNPGFRCSEENGSSAYFPWRAAAALAARSANS